MPDCTQYELALEAAQDEVDDEQTVNDYLSGAKADSDGRLSTKMAARDAACQALSDCQTGGP